MLNFIENQEIPQRGDMLEKPKFSSSTLGTFSKDFSVFSCESNKRQIPQRNI